MRAMIMALALLLSIAGRCAVDAEDDYLVDSYNYTLIEEEHEYEHDGKKLYGYLIYQDIPDNPPRPGLMMNPGFWGDGGGASEKAYAREYARKGMVVLLPDWMAGRHTDEKYLSFIYSFLLYDYFLGNTVLAQERALRAYEELAALNVVDESRIGAIGYCFGGAMALNTARAGADLVVAASNHGEYPELEEVTGTYNVDFFLEMIGADDVLIPPAARTEWDEELSGYTEGTAMDYEIVVWPSPNVHGFSIEYSAVLYNTFQAFGLNSLAVYNQTCAIETFARIDELFKSHSLLPDDAPATYCGPTTPREAPAFVRFCEGLANTFKLQRFYTQVFVPVAGGIIYALDPEGQRMGGVFFFLFLLLVPVCCCCCQMCCNWCCCYEPACQKKKEADGQEIQLAGGDSLQQKVDSPVV